MSPDESFYYRLKCVKSSYESRKIIELKEKREKAKQELVIAISKISGSSWVSHVVDLMLSDRLGRQIESAQWELRKQRAREQNLRCLDLSGGISSCRIFIEHTLQMNVVPSVSESGLADEIAALQREFSEMYAIDPLIGRTLGIRKMSPIGPDQQPIPLPDQDRIIVPWKNWQSVQPRPGVGDLREVERILDAWDDRSLVEGPTLDHVKGAMETIFGNRYELLYIDEPNPIEEGRAEVYWLLEQLIKDRNLGWDYRKDL